MDSKTPVDFVRPTALARLEYADARVIRTPDAQKKLELVSAGLKLVLVRNPHYQQVSFGRRDRTAAPLKEIGEALGCRLVAETKPETHHANIPLSRGGRKTTPTWLIKSGDRCFVHWSRGDVP